MAVEKSKTVKIKIMAMDGDNGDVFLSVNAKNVLIKRGVEVEVGQEYVEVLKNSVINTIVHDFDANGEKVSRAVQLQRYPYQVV